MSGRLQRLNAQTQTTLKVATKPLGNSRYEASVSFDKKAFSSKAKSTALAAQIVTAKVVKHANSKGLTKPTHVEIDGFRMAL